MAARGYAEMSHGSGVMRRDNAGDWYAAGEAAARSALGARHDCAQAGQSGRAVTVMTQQYIAGELSLLLAQLRTVAENEPTVRDFIGLRREAETLPPSALGSVTVRAIALADLMCWSSVASGDIAAFSRQALACANLYEFGVCAGLLEEDWYDGPVHTSQPSSNGS
jgi:hypothetical protein